MLDYICKYQTTTNFQLNCYLHSSYCSVCGSTFANLKMVYNLDISLKKPAFKLYQARLFRNPQSKQKVKFKVLSRCDKVLKFTSKTESNYVI